MGKAAFQLFLLVLTLGLAGVGEPVRGEDLARIKAAYLYHFVNFTQWPQDVGVSTEDAVRLCLLGAGSVDAQLQRMDVVELGLNSKPRLVRVRKEELPDSCQVVFVGEAADVETEALLARLRGAPLLSVSDQPEFARRGGMIEMFLRDDKVRMRVNLNAVRAAGIHLSSKLLRLAEIVEAP